MPIITLYGAKGGTGRTTVAAAVARGMLARGMDVTLVETAMEDDPLARWVAEINDTEPPSGDLIFRDCFAPGDIDMLMRYAAPDDRHAIIFDTTPFVSAVRTYAFELADLVIMPFSGYLDADIGIARASGHLPRTTNLCALAVRAPDHVAERVKDWMPVLKSALPDDERLILHSDASRGLTQALSDGVKNIGVDPSSLSDLLFNLSIEAHESPACEKRPPARALLDANARLAVPA